MSYHYNRFERRAEECHAMVTCEHGDLNTAHWDSEDRVVRRLMGSGDIVAFGEAVYRIWDTSEYMMCGMIELKTASGAIVVADGVDGMWWASPDQISAFEASEAS